MSRKPGRVRGGVGIGMCLALAVLVAPARADENAKPGARFVPAEKLAIYFESDGLKPHEEGWHKTAAYRLLHETTAGAMFDDLAGQMIKLVLGPEGRNRPSAEEVKAVLDHVMQNGLTFGVCGPFEPPGVEPLGVLVLPNAARADVRAVFDRLIQLAIPPGTNTREVKLGDRTALVIEGGQGRTSWAYWTEGDDVVIAIGHGAEGFHRVVAVIEGEQPSAEKNPSAPAPPGTGGLRAGSFRLRGSVSPARDASESQVHRSGQHSTDHLRGWLPGRSHRKRLPYRRTGAETRRAQAARRADVRCEIPAAAAARSDRFHDPLARPRQAARRLEHDA